MKKLINVLVITAIALGFTACNKERGPKEATGDTFIGLTVKFPVAPSAKALPGDYNEKGEWQGRDLIKALKVYVVNTTANTIDATSFTQASFYGITSNGELNPKLAVVATAGDNVQAYVVLNDINAKVTTDLDAVVNAGDFAAAYAAVVQVAAVADVASTELDGTATKDVVLMTNQVLPTGMLVQPNISEVKAISGVANQMQVNVSRVSSRGILTIKEGYNTEVEVKNNLGEPTSKITIRSVQYQVTGSSLQFNVLEDRTTWKVPTDVYGYVPTNNTGWIPTNPDPTNIFLYTDATSWQDVIAKADNSDANIIAALEAETYSKFVLPVTHDDANYRRGNIAMFEIKATFTPDNVDGAAYTGGETPTTVYLGLKDGLFYSTKTRAEEMDVTIPIENPTVNHRQDVREYVGGETFYYLWLNPDKPYGGTEKISKSPTVRNQVYHAHINGFKEIGVANKDEIDPDDPPQTDKTYLSVQMSVLPWTIHSYTVDLGNDY